MGTRLAWLFIGFLAGVALTRFVADSPTPRATAAESRAPSAVTPPAPALPAPAPTSPEAAEPAPLTQPDPVADRYALLRSLDALHQADLLNYSASIFDQNHHLTEKAKTLLLLTERETGEVNAVMDELRRRVAEIEHETATTRFDPEKNTFTIDIPPFPERGGKLYDEAAAKLLRALGPERGEVLVNVGRLEEQFSEFGIGVREITVSRSSNPDGTTHYSINDQRRIRPHDSGAGPVQYRSSSSTGRSVESRDALVETLGPLAEKLLPGDF